jgi:RNA polymerase sigma-70 factor, ECF subfamily
LVTISYRNPFALTSLDYAAPIESRLRPIRQMPIGQSGEILVADIYRSIEAEIPRLRRYARALARDMATADDLVQDCLVRALDKQHLWHEGTDLRAWLFTILHNQHVNHVRRAIREGAAVGLNGNEAMAATAQSPAKSLELRDLERAIGKLPEEQRSVILLVGLEGMRYEQVAEILGVPVGTVRSRLSRGRDALRRLIGIIPDRRAEQIMAEPSGARRPAQRWLDCRRPAVAARLKDARQGAHRRAQQRTQPSRASFEPASGQKSFAFAEPHRR